MTATDEQGPREGRPVSTALARVGEKALDAPGAAVVGFVEEAKRSYLGVIAYSHDLREYRTVAARRRELAEAKRRAEAGAGKHPPPTALDAIEKEQARRTRILIAAVAGVAVLLLVASVSQYRWDPWLYLAAGTPIVLLILGRYYRARWVTALAPISTPALLPWGIEGMRWWPAAVLAALAALACEYRGALVVPPGPAVPDSAKGLTRRDWMTLWATVERVMLVRGKDVTRTDNARPISGEGEELGVSFGVRCPDPITPDDVRALEREVGFPVGASAFVLDPRAAGAGDLRLLWADPLPPYPNPRREPMTLSYERPIPLVRKAGGEGAGVALNRTRLLLVGDSGSGKSEALQDILDGVCDMPDAEWSAIDLQDGPTFPAYRGQWNCRGVFTDLDSATAHLRELRAWCRRRNQLLRAGMDADEDGVVDPYWIVGPEPGRRAHVLFIDELSTATVDKAFASELTLLLEVIRKASGSLVMATPDLDKDRVPRAVIDQASVKLGFSCPFSDSQQLFGKGSTQSGWEPYNLIAAEGDEPNDAGKCFIRGGGLNRPEVYRFGRMDKYERRDRNLLRKQWRASYIPPETAEDGDDGVVDAVEVPEPLATLADLSEAGDVHTSTLLEALPDGWTARGVADALRPHGVTAGNVVVGGVQRKGYRADQVERAVQALDSETP